MTREQKELLLKDLCARLPYGVKIDNVGEPSMLISINNRCRIIVETGEVDKEPRLDVLEIEDCKPYLFPLSSMTEEQKEFIKNKFCYDWDIDDHPYSLWAQCVDIGDADDLIDWFHKNHFDYRGLIPMGLANDATGLNIY